MPSFVAHTDDDGIRLDEVRRSLEIFVDPAYWVHLTASPHWRPQLCDGSDIEGMMSVVQSLSNGRGTYFGLNPLNPHATGSVRSADVVYRRWLLVDVDHNFECSGEHSGHRIFGHLAHRFDGDDRCRKSIR